MGADLTIGPVIDEGFYYDCCLDGRTIREEDLAAIEKKIQTVINERQVFQRVRVSREEALGMFQENKFKVELINGLPEVGYKTLGHYFLLLTLFPRRPAPWLCFLLQKELTYIFIRVRVCVLLGWLAG